MLKTCIILGSFGILLVAGLPAPQDDYVDEYADEYADEEVCVTTKDSKASEKECVFPFTFNNFTYNGCPPDPTDETKTKRWCSTKVDETGNHIAGGDNWGYCTEGCSLEILPDELELGSEAGEAASDVCDWTACNGFTLKANVFGKEETYGQCQFPANNNGSEGDDFFCFVNADSNCADKTFYDQENNLLVSSTACTDPRAPLPRAFSISFGGGRRRNSFSGGSSHTDSYGCKTGYLSYLNKNIPGCRPGCGWAGGNCNNNRGSSNNNSGSSNNNRGSGSPRTDSYGCYPSSAYLSYLNKKNPACRQYTGGNSNNNRGSSNNNSGSSNNNRGSNSGDFNEGAFYSNLGSGIGGFLSALGRK